MLGPNLAKAWSEIWMNVLKILPCFVGEPHLLRDTRCKLKMWPTWWSTQERHISEAIFCSPPGRKLTPVGWRFCLACRGDPFSSLYWQNVSLQISIFLPHVSYCRQILLFQWHQRKRKKYVNQEERKMSHVCKKNYEILWEFFPTWGVSPIPKTFVILKIALKSPKNHQNCWQKHPYHDKWKCQKYTLFSERNVT